MSIIKRESLKLSLKPLALSIAVLAATVSAPTFAEWRVGEEITDAIKGGKAFADLRLRFEDADIANGNGEDAQALTLRTTFGYETGTYKGFSVSEGSC